MATIGSVVSITKPNFEVPPSASPLQPRLTLIGFQGRKSSNCVQNGLKLGFSVAICGESIWGLTRNLVQWRGNCRQHLRSRCRAAKRDDGDEPDDPIEATIQKSKKVLAMQQDLLQQIAERRKLVSSIKNSIITEEESTSYDENDVSLSDLDPASTGTSGVALADENGISLSDLDLTLTGTSGVASYDENDIPLSDIDLASTGTSGVASYNENDNSLANLAHASSNSDSIDVEYPSGDFSRNFVPSTSVDGSGDAQRGGYVGEKKSRGNSYAEEVFSYGDYSTQFQKNRVQTVEPEVSSFPSSEAYGVEDRKYEKPTSASSADADSELDGAPKEEDVKPPPLAGVNVMNIILIAAECAPWCKTGGLGDVAGALPKALARRGHRVMVVVPRYGNYAELNHTGIRKTYMVHGQSIEVNYYHAYIDGVDFVFIDSHMFLHLDNNIYGGQRVDILKRMALFCKAAVEVPWHVPCGGVCYGDGNLVFIANDWHTALLPVYLKAYYRDQGLMKYTRSVLVIHNIAHQGRGPPEDFSYVDLPDHYRDLFMLYDPVGGDHFNIFAAGLKAADRIVTVSHGYAWELKTSEGGWGLHHIINENDWKLRGIVNGIDTKEWSPQCDAHLKSDGYVNYSLETLQTGKAQCKAALQKELGLPVRDDVPLIGFIGRLDNQKGVDLIAEAVPWMMSQDVQLVMLGSGRPDLEQLLRQFDSQHNNKIRGWVGFSVKTAHRITAGADILLMPSRFEPCGLNQLYAMNYGTIPVVHAVGGLRDTVQPFDPYNETGLGWTFNRAEAGKLIHALGNCLLTYREYKKSWEGLQRRGMTQDLSWDHAAQNYEEVLVAAKYQW